MPEPTSGGRRPQSRRRSGPDRTGSVFYRGRWYEPKQFEVLRQRARNVASRRIRSLDLAGREEGALRSRLASMRWGTFSTSGQWHEFFGVFSHFLEAQAKRLKRQVGERLIKRNRAAPIPAEPPKGERTVHSLKGMGRAAYHGKEIHDLAGLLAVADEIEGELKAEGRWHLDLAARLGFGDPHASPGAPSADRAWTRLHELREIYAQAKESAAELDRQRRKVEFPIFENEHALFERFIGFCTSGLADVEEKLEDFR